MLQKKTTMPCSGMRIRAMLCGKVLPGIETSHASFALFIELELEKNCNMLRDPLLLW